jgi:hypothetical protein
MTMRDDGHGATTVIVLAGAWLAVATAAPALGYTQALRPPAPQAIVGTLTLLSLLAVAVLPPLRRWARAVDLRVLVALHVTRLLAGAYFLVLYRRGELPYAFAVPGGLGDMLVGLLAIALLVGVRPDTVGGRRLYSAWNLLGLVDILFVVATATRIGVADPGALQPLLELPLSLLPTWLVPLIIASHALIVWRLARPTVGAR